MPLDPSTLIARTSAGDAELAAPRHGLAIAQRRLLTLLDQPLALDELVARPGLQPGRLERDLERLAEGGLIEIHRPAGSSGPVFAQRRLPPAAVVIPPPPSPTIAPDATMVVKRTGPAGGPATIRRVRRGRALLVGFASLVAVGTGLWFLAAPAHEPPPPVSPPTAPTGTATPGALRNASAGSTATASRALEPVRAVSAAPGAP